MNAIDKAPAGPDRHDCLALPSFTAAGRWARRLAWLAVLCLGSAAALTAAWVAAGHLPPDATAASLHQAGLVSVLVGSLLLPATGFVLAYLLCRARRNAAQDPPSAGRWRFIPRIRRGDLALPGRAARWPQAIGAVMLAGPAALAAVAMPSSPAATQPQSDILFGALALLLTFPLLLTERWLAAVPDTHLPEGGALRRLMLVPVLAWPMAGLAQMTGSLGLPASVWVDGTLRVLIVAIAAEVMLRAAGRCFLPPPQPHQAVAAIDSLLVRFIADGLRSRGLSEPVRQHLGIDFSRSWALAYLRAATPPVLLLLMLLAWSLTGVVMVGVDQRAVYQRFGAPAGVLHAGAHLILPWPMGTVRRLEYGVIHEATLADSTAASAPMLTGAEDAPPPDADRLWEQPHPAELDFLIASAGASGDAGAQSFQVVSADIRLRYRIGLSDADAMRTAFQVTDPLTLLRGAASRDVARFFVDQRLDTVLGEDREAIAERLRTRLRQELGRIGSGIDLTAVTIEAIHPPAGAAEAYHAVQAAEIRAQTAIAAERSSASAEISKARQYAGQLIDQARAAAAETVAMARSDSIRFDADLAADRASPDSFRLERRLSALTGSLVRVPLTILDHRIPPGNAPVLDLRPLSPATGRSTPADQE